jgi:hypothetical protein
MKSLPTVPMRGKCGNSTLPAAALPPSFLPKHTARSSAGIRFASAECGRWRLLLAPPQLLLAAGFSEGEEHFRDQEYRHCGP